MSYLYCINSIRVELCLKGGKNYAFIMDTIKKLFGRRLAELRGKRGWTQEKLAEKIGIDQRNVSKIENGNTFPGRCLAKIPEAFGFPIKDFFDCQQDEEYLIEYYLNNADLVISAIGKKYILSEYNFKKDAVLIEEKTSKKQPSTTEKVKKVTKKSPKKKN